MKQDNSTEALLKVLCSINNRLSDIAMTLQTIGWLCTSGLDGGNRELWRKQLLELTQAQHQTYADLTVQCME